MAISHETESLIAQISDIATDLARLCPDQADRAQELVQLVGQLRAVPLDRSLVEDAIATEAVGSDLSDAQVRTAADTVVRTARDVS